MSIRYSIAVLLFAAAPIMADGLTSVNTRGSYATGVFDDSAAEIGAYDAATQRLFVVNGETGGIDVLDLSDPSNITLLFTIDLSAYGDGANSVASWGGYLVAAVQNANRQLPGKAVFMDAAGNVLSSVDVGALPDMATFTPDGTKVLIANEGEPDDDYLVDPEGSVSIIDISGGIASVTNGDVTTAGFSAFNGATLEDSINIYGPGASVAQDLEPEYIAVSADSSTAYAICQENNALAVIDLNSGTVVALLGLGFKDHSLTANAMDPSNRDDAINIATWPVYGMYQPDAIAAFSVGGVQYLISANEGDSRDYDGYSEEERVKDLTLDPVAFPDAATLQEDENLGRLKITTSRGDDGNDGDYETLYSYGARSFSIWNAGNGALVYDSGDDIEQLLAAELAMYFNSTNDDNDSFDNRSDDKGPEPEGVTVGWVANVPYAFVGLERVGGFLVVDLSNPAAPVIVSYINNRNFTVDADTAAALDLGPEGLTFINAADSATGQPLLAVMNEVSGTTTVYEIEDDCAEPSITFVDDIGGNGINITGTPYCAYNVQLTDGEGNVIPNIVGVDANGNGTLDVTIGEDWTIGAYQIGASTPSDTAVTVPTLQTWALMILTGIMLTAGMVALRRRRAQA